MEMLMLLLKAVGAGIGIVLFLFVFIWYIFWPFFRWFGGWLFSGNPIGIFVVFLTKRFLYNASMLMETEEEVNEEVRNLREKQGDSREFFDYFSKVVGVHAAVAAVFLLLLQIWGAIQLAILKVIVGAFGVVGKVLEFLLSFITS